MSKLNLNTASLAQVLIALPYVERMKMLRKLTDEDFMGLYYDWSFWARKNQLEPVELQQIDKFIWLVLAGRGFGKTRTGAEWVIEKVRNHGYRYVTLVGANATDVRKIMIEGESGILQHSPPWFMPTYEPSKMILYWPNGAVANIYYGTEPDSSRGAQSDLVWMDELAKWKYPQDTYDNIMLGLRLGENPLCMVSTTPKPTKFLKSVINDPATVVTAGNTYENMDNLAAPFIHTVIRKYEGTRIGKQELYAKLLDDNPNALWKRKWLDDYRISLAAPCHRIVVSIDPAGTEPEEGKEATENGIIVVGEGRALEGMRNRDMTHYYVFEDLSLQASPDGWAREAQAGYNKFKCDAYVAEKNFGGAMVKSTIRNVDRNNTVHVITASRGKTLRAEPVSGLYEQGRVHHVGTFGLLEDELCEWQQGQKSPNRLDALVHGINFLTGQDLYAPAPDTSKHNRPQFKSQVMGVK
jgi:phage terminase large subunit-like protein